MLEKNIRRKEAKKNRVWFEMRLGTIEHKSALHPSRQEDKRKTREMSFKYGRV